MEIQLGELIEKIKKDGVQSAETEAESILNSAKAQADKIISDAKAEAEKIMSNAKAENEKTVKSGEDALRQAGRNILISFRESVTKEMSAIVGENVNNAYSPEALPGIIANVVQTMSANPDFEDVSVILNNRDFEALEGAVLSALREKMINGVTLKSNDNFDSGFRISVNDGKAYYDYSAKAVTEMLSNYLSPKVSALLKEAE